MSALTRCPHCASVFRVRPEQLEIADGWAQCGVCGQAFDARAACLNDPAEAPPSAPEAISTGTSEREPPSAARPQTTSDAPAAPPDPAPAWAGPAVALDEAPNPNATPAQPPAPAADTPKQAIPPGSRGRISPDPPAFSARIEYAEPRSSPPARARPRLAGLGAALLLVLLLAQAAWLLRLYLVEHMPALRPAFDALCAPLGCTLPLPRRLDALTVIGSDLTAEPDARYQLSFTLANRAGEAVAWPHIVLTLTNPAGQPILRRGLAPQDYLDPASHTEPAGVPARSETQHRIAFRLDGIEPVGYDLKLAD